MHNNDDENKNTLRHFLEQLSNKGLPDGWRQSEIGKQAWEIGHQDGYMKGLRDAWAEANTVINSVRNIIELHDRRVCDDFEE